jgi:hypothetical protein
MLTQSVIKWLNFYSSLGNTSFPFVENMTISAGLARISPYDFPIAVLESADKALYYAKIMAEINFVSMKIYLPRT